MGVPVDGKKAETLFFQAADLDESTGYVGLGNMYSVDPENGQDI